MKTTETPRQLRTGIEGFDKLLKTGIPKGSAILVEGGPGSGKTIFCLQIMYNACLKGKKALYMSFEEPEKRLKAHMESFGWNADKFEKKGLLVIKRFDALDISRSVEALLSEAKRELLIEIQPVLIPKDFKPDIVCMDSLTSIASAFSGEESRFRIYMEQLFRYLEKNNITSFLIRETASPTHTGTSFAEKGEAVSFLSDGIVVMYNVIFSNGKRGRAFEVLKMRGEEIDRRIVESEIINKKGVVIYPGKNLLSSSRLTYKLT
jgi:circadian clock protein KaiC